MSSKQIFKCMGNGVVLSIGTLITIIGINIIFVAIDVMPKHQGLATFAIIIGSGLTTSMLSIAVYQLGGGK